MSEYEEALLLPDLIIQCWLSCQNTRGRGYSHIDLQWYTVVPVHRIIFCHDTNIVYWTRYRDIYDTFWFTYASTNMGKHCLQLLVLTLLLFSPYTRRFSEKTDEKNPCWAVYSIILNMADSTNAFVIPTRLVSCTDFWAHGQDTRRHCYVTYRIVTIVSGYVSHRGKMYRRCRPPKGYGFGAVLVWNRVIDFAFLDWNT